MCPCYFPEPDTDPVMDGHGAVVDGHGAVVNVHGAVVNGHGAVVARPTERFRLGPARCTGLNEAM
jgi:hypothetical protein